MFNPMSEIPQHVLKMPPMEMDHSHEAPTHIDIPLHLEVKMLERRAKKESSSDNPITCKVL